MTVKLKIGSRAEESACEFLKKQGLYFCDRNYRTKLGEIDLIMKDGDEIVFIEVRMRNNHDYGSGIDSVNFFKQRKIIQTALQYLSSNRLLDKVDCRFDVIGINYLNNQPTIEWIPNAFSVDDFGW